MPARHQRREIQLPGDPDSEDGWPCLIGAHLLSLELRGLSPCTVTGRRKLLGRFARWALAHDLPGPVPLTQRELAAYRLDLHHHRTGDGTPLTARSQQQHIVALRVFYRWLIDRRQLEVDPTASLETPRAPCRLPQVVLGRDQVEAVLSTADVGCPLGVRNRAILEVLYATGLRRAELAAVELSDIDLARRTLFVRNGKGGRDRLVPLGARAAGWLRSYLAAARPHLVAGRVDPSTLFITRDSTPICHAQIGKLVRAHLRGAGVSAGNCHLFRHALATGMLRGGADIRWVQAILGHHSLTSTQLYTHVEISDLSAVHTATHPAARQGGDTHVRTVRITVRTAGQSLIPSRKRPRLLSRR